MKAFSDDRVRQNIEPAGATGASPAGAGVASVGSAIGGAVAGALIGTVAGPIGAGIGAAIGMVAGGLSHKGVGAGVQSTAPIPTAPSHEAVAQTAYSIWERKGYMDGHALEDWLEAESILRTAT